MHRADRPLALPAMVAGIGALAGHRGHPLSQSRDERLAIEAGAFAATAVRHGERQADPTPTTALPRSQPARDPIRS